MQRRESGGGSKSMFIVVSRMAPLAHEDADARPPAARAAALVCVSPGVELAEPGERRRALPGSDWQAMTRAGDPFE
jgi:hypothetical protein